MKKQMKSGRMNLSKGVRKRQCKDGGHAIQALPHIKKVAKASVQDTENFVEIYEFRREGGDLCFAAIAASESTRPEGVRRMLADRGLAGNTHPRIRELVAEAAFSAPPRLGTVLIRGGWIGTAGELFALPERIVSGPRTSNSPHEYFLCPNFNLKDRCQLVSKDGSSISANLAIARKGSTKSWKKTIGALALNSSAMMLAISASIAAPLLRLTNETPFSIILTGPSSSEKTMITLASASFIGIGTELGLANWNVSEAGLEERAEIHSDLCLHIDDIKNYGGSDKDAYRLIKTVAYRITSGAKKMTHIRAKTSITGRPPVPHGINTLIVTSSENSFEELGRAAGEKLPEGVPVRFIEIPIPRRDDGGVFDLLPRRGSGAQQTEARATVARQIVAACAAHHGSPLRKLLQAITNNPTEARRTVNRYRKEFDRFVSFDRKDSLQLRHANRFAFLYAAGAYAIEKQLWPWRHDQLRTAMLTCHDASRASSMPKSTAAAPDKRLKDGLSRLATLLKDKQRISTSLTVTHSESAGWKKTKPDRVVYYVRGTAWRALFDSKAQRRIVENYLLRKKNLRSGPGGLITVQPRSRNGERGPRCYQLSFPLRPRNSKHGPHQVK